MFFGKKIDKKEIAVKLYSRASEKFHLLNNIIERTDILEKYDYESDYYKIMAYMYICNFYKMKMKNKYGLAKMKKILIHCFQMVSDTLISSKYKKSGDELLLIFRNRILPDFEINGNNAIQSGESPFIYMGAQFLFLIFDISINEIKTNYYEVIENINNLFMSIFDDDDYNLL